MAADRCAGGRRALNAGSQTVSSCLRTFYIILRTKSADSICFKIYDFKSSLLLSDSKSSFNL